MNNVYREAITEVLEVLKNSNKSIVKKIPKKFILFLIQNKDDDYIVKIDFNNANWDDSIKKETQAILALIYRDYIVSPEERNKLIAEEKKEKNRIENELKEKYNQDNIFKKSQTAIQKDLENNNQLIEVKKYPWYKKIYYKALKILGLKNKN